MKNFIFSALVIVSAFASISCDRHEWENSEEGVIDGTKNLFLTEEKHDDHSGHDHPAHGEDHADPGH